jgi:hypothetical protein
MHRLVINLGGHDGPQEWDAFIRPALRRTKGARAVWDPKEKPSYRYPKRMAGGE